MADDDQNDRPASSRSLAEPQPGDRPEHYTHQGRRLNRPFVSSRTAPVPTEQHHTEGDT